MAADGDILERRIEKALAGDQAALELVLLHFHDPLRRYLCRALQGHESSGVTADDALQETLMQAFRDIHKVEARGTLAFAAWLKTIAKTRLINMLKKARAVKRGGGGASPQLPPSHQSPLSPQTPISPRARSLSPPALQATANSIFARIAGREPTPSLVLRRKEAVAALAAAVALLDDPSRRVIEMRYAQQLVVRDIAATIGKSEGAVKMILHRATRQLRQTLELANFLLPL